MYIEFMEVIHPSVCAIIKNLFLQIVMSGELVSNETLVQSYLSTHEGESRFNFIPPRGSLHVLPTTTTTTTTTTCTRGEWKHLICSTFTCPSTNTCSRKVRPLDDCCDRCGAALDLDVDLEVHVKKCTEELRSLLDDVVEYSRVGLYVSVREKEETVQMKPKSLFPYATEVLFTDENAGMLAESAAEYVRQYLENSQSKVSMLL